MPNNELLSRIFQLVWSSLEPSGMHGTSPDHPDPGDQMGSSKQKGDQGAQHTFSSDSTAAGGLWLESVDNEREFDGSYNAAPRWKFCTLLHYQPPLSSSTDSQFASDILLANWFNQRTAAAAVVWTYFPPHILVLNMGTLPIAVPLLIALIINSISTNTIAIEVLFQSPRAGVMSQANEPYY